MHNPSKSRKPTLAILCCACVVLGMELRSLKKIPPPLSNRKLPMCQVHPCVQAYDCPQVWIYQVTKGLVDAGAWFVCRLSGSVLDQVMVGTGLMILPAPEPACHCQGCVKCSAALHRHKGCL